MKGNLTQKLSMIQARHCNSFNLGYISINQSDKNFCICKSGDGKRNYTVLLNSQCCDDWQCNLKCSNCKPCVPRYTCSCVDFLLYLYNMYISISHHYRKRNERKTKIWKQTIAEGSNDKDGEFIQLTGIVKDETKLIYFLTYLLWLKVLIKDILMQRNMFWKLQ